MLTYDVNAVDLSKCLPIQEVAMPEAFSRDEVAARLESLLTHEIPAFIIKRAGAAPRGESEGVGIHEDRLEFLRERLAVHHPLKRIITSGLPTNNGVPALEKILKLEFSITTQALAQRHQIKIAPN